MLPGYDFFLKNLQIERNPDVPRVPASLKLKDNVSCWSSAMTIDV